MNIQKHNTGIVNTLTNTKKTVWHKTEICKYNFWIYPKSTSSFNMYISRRFEATVISCLWSEWEYFSSGYCKCEFYFIKVLLNSYSIFIFFDLLNISFQTTQFKSYSTNILDIVEKKLYICNENAFSSKQY